MGGKTAQSALDINDWVDKNIRRKFGRYLEARQYLPCYEDATIGFDFLKPVTDPVFKVAVEAEVARLRIENPNVTILLNII